MGASISMRPGSIMRATGAPVDITPGWRSKAVDALEETFGALPVELLLQEDEERLNLLARGAGVFCSDKENMWLELLTALRTHGVLTIAVEY